MTPETIAPEHAPEPSYRHSPDYRFTLAALGVCLVILFASWLTGGRPLSGIYDVWSLYAGVCALMAVMRHRFASAVLFVAAGVVLSLFASGAV